MSRLLLVGAGHAHLGVLESFAQAPVPGLEICLVTPYPRQIYSGMLPGWIAGHYDLAQCAIDVVPLARRAQARCVFDRVVGLNLSKRQALTAHGKTLDFDWVCIDTGAVANDTLRTKPYSGMAIRPIEDFVGAWPQQALTMQSAVVTVVGGGAAGVELVLAMAWRFGPASSVKLRLVTGRRGALPLWSASMRRRVYRHLRRAQVDIVEADVAAIEDRSIMLDGDQVLHSDWTLLATGAAAAAWPAQSGLATDLQGFILTLSTLQSSSHPFVFAAGDCASMRLHPRARSGVYAVRAAPMLAHNFRCLAAGQPLREFVPQPRALYVLATGPRYAIASWGSLSAEGRWVWRWKNWIDQRFMARFRV